MSQSQSQSQPHTQSKSGPCSVCGSIYKLFPLAGVLVLNKHGHGHGRPACPGTYLPPTPTLSVPPGSSALSSIPGDTLSPSPPGPQGDSQLSGPGVEFRFQVPSRPVLPRIPKGARLRASQVLDKRLRDVINGPDDLNAWSALLEFGSLFSQPTRGGIHRNLTSILIKRLDVGAVEQALCPTQAATLVGRPRKQRPPLSQEDSAVRRTSRKLQDGDVRGAVRSLTSFDQLAPLSSETIEALRRKHPSCPTDRRQPPIVQGQALVITEDDIRAAIRSFASGSAGGRDGFRPQHIKDLITVAGSCICETLVDFSNLVLGGGVPLSVRPAFFGATLIPLAKKGGGLRPIAIGLLLRRVVSKAAAHVASLMCVSLLSPIQLGVGTRGGAEALVHAARQYLANKPADHAFVKLDFANAFNTIRRDSMLEAVASACPSLLNYALSSYGGKSHLWLGDDILSSEEGVQQGDPLGPLLFCLTIHPLLSGGHTTFVSGYLDDVGLGDSVSSLIDRVRSLETEAHLLGLSLNHEKCEVAGLASEYVPLWDDSGLKFSRTNIQDLSLLGSPLNMVGVDAALAASAVQLREIEPRLHRLPAHEAFYLLKASFGVPRLNYLLRTAPTYASSYCSTLSFTIRDVLSNISNIQLTDEAWKQASLPVRWGGIGIRDVSSLAPSAYLGSLFATEPLVRSILPPSMAPLPTFLSEATQAWQLLAGAGGVPPQGDDSRKQRAWDDLICRAAFDNLIARPDQVSRARLLASASIYSGSWLHTLPCRNLGLALSDREFRVAVGLRLGAPLVRPHTCVCGADVDSLGHHGLSCRRSSGRQRRHAQANDVLVRAIRAADVQAELEPRFLQMGGEKRPDGATLDPWSHGRCLAWDFTCPDTVAPSYVNNSASSVGSAALKAEQNKILKYSQVTLAGNILFAPFAIETLGSWGPSATELCREIGSRLAAISGDPRSHTFLVQRLMLAVQRGNAASIAGTHPLVNVSVGEDSSPA
jgi:hypothetical protein